MPAGGKRPGAGRKPQTVVHEIILRETQPGRFEEIAEATDSDLTPLAVMQDNMAFFHRKAGEVLAAIMAKPLGADVNEDQLQALKDLAGVIKMREMSQQCARDLAPYVHSKKPPESAKESREKPAAIQHIPTPQAVVDAFQRAAEGLPPEPRKRL